jgi:cytochrome P450
MYMEGFRLATGVALARSPAQPKVKLGKWSFHRDEMLFAVNWQGAHDEVFWNSGSIVNGKAEHPVNTFWAERFLECPDDPIGGPIRKTKPGIETKKPSPKTPKDDAKAELVTTGFESYYFPYGGGANICPGRNFAKTRNSCFYRCCYEGI